MWADIYQTETAKPLKQFIADFSSFSESKGFIIHNASQMEMAHTFVHHGVEVGEEFDLHMIQLCKPTKAGNSLSQNPERAPLMPKFVITFTKKGKTQIRFLRYNRPMIEALVDDPAFADSLEESFSAITKMIEATK